jgi:hypothetical protein
MKINIFDFKLLAFRNFLNVSLDKIIVVDALLINKKYEKK